MFHNNSSILCTWRLYFFVSPKRKNADIRKSVKLKGKVVLRVF